jgi:hypothetical protein
MGQSLPILLWFAAAIIGGFSYLSGSGDVLLALALTVAFYLLSFAVLRIPRPARETEATVKAAFAIPEETGDTLLLVNTAAGDNRFGDATPDALRPRLFRKMSAMQARQALLRIA